MILARKTMFQRCVHTIGFLGKASPPERRGRCNLHLAVLAHSLHPLSAVGSWRFAFHRLGILRRSIGTRVALPLTFYYFGLDALFHCPSLERVAQPKNTGIHTKGEDFENHPPCPLQRGTHSADSERTNCERHSYWFYSNTCPSGQAGLPLRMTA